LKVAAIVANALRAVLTVNALKAHRAGLKAVTALRVGTTVSVRPAGLKVVAIVANVLRVALTANVAKAHPAASKAAQIAANALPAVSKAAAPRAVTTANAARSVVRV
jgi:hypothetical protein